MFAPTTDLNTLTEIETKKRFLSKTRFANLPKITNFATAKRAQTRCAAGNETLQTAFKVKV